MRSRAGPGAAVAWWRRLALQHSVSRATTSEAQRCSKAIDSDNGHQGLEHDIAEVGQHRRRADAPPVGDVVRHRRDARPHRP